MVLPPCAVLHRVYEADAVEGEILDRVGRVSENHTRRSFGSIYRDVAQHDVAKGARGRVAICRLDRRPAQGAWVPMARVVRTRARIDVLLRRSDPQRPARRFIDVDVLVQDVLDDTALPTTAAKLDVYALVCVSHKHIPKGDVAHVVVTDGADGETNARGADVLDEHVGSLLAVGLDRKGIVLVPHVTVMDVDVCPGNVEAVSVECRQIDGSVRVRAGSASRNLGVANDGIPQPSGVKVEPRRVEHENVLECEPGGIIHIDQRWPVLSTPQVPDPRKAPPGSSLAIERARAVGGNFKVYRVFEDNACLGHFLSRLGRWPALGICRELQGSVQLQRD